MIVSLSVLFTSNIDTFWMTCFESIPFVSHFANVIIFAQNPVSASLSLLKSSCFILLRVRVTTFLQHTNLILQRVLQVLMTDKCPTVLLKSFITGSYELCGCSSAFLHVEEN